MQCFLRELQTASLAITIDKWLGRRFTSHRTSRTGLAIENLCLLRFFFPIDCFVALRLQLRDCSRHGRDMSRIRSAAASNQPHALRDQLSRCLGEMIWRRLIDQPAGRRFRIPGIRISRKRLIQSWNSLQQLDHVMW